MKKSYAKSLKEYDGAFELDSKKILAAMKRFKDVRKRPTSVALDETTIQELKYVAEKQGIPYQVLIRVFVKALPVFSHFIKRRSRARRKFLIPATTSAH